MSQPPDPYGQPPDPYGQPPQSSPPAPTSGWPAYGQPPTDPPPPPANPYGPPTSGAGYQTPGYQTPGYPAPGYQAPPTSGAGYQAPAYPPTSGAGYQAPPTSGAGYGPPAYPTGAFPATGYLGDPALGGVPPQQPKKRRGLLITTIVLAIVVLLCGGGGTAAYFLVKKVDGKGQATPVAAVDGFLTAVFHDGDANRAATFVCSASRNKASLTKKIEELKTYQDQYKSPQFSWPTPTVEKQNKTEATLTVPVKLSTAADQVSEKKLRFITVNEAGWWVCEVSDAG